MKMRKILLSAVLSLVAGLSAFALNACEDETPSTGNPPTSEQTGGGNPNDEQQETKITVIYDANGGAFDGGDTTLTQTVNADTVLTAPTSPKRTNYTFAGWATDKNGGSMWIFDTDKPTENVTLYAIWKQPSGKILSVENATMDGDKIFMLVNHSTEVVSLSSKVVCSDDSTWKLYYDKLGQTEIPTKIASSAYGELDDGDNIFYMVATSQDGTQVNVYELNVYRSYAVAVNFYDGTEFLKTETAYTGYEYTTSYTPNITGYTFNDWNYTPRVLWDSLNLYADTTANTYTVTYDVNSGDALSTTEKTVTYDSGYTLAKPTKTGYSFLGWYLGSTQMTYASGGSLTPWKYDSDKTLKAKWQANEYVVTLNRNNTSAGTVTGAGDHAYDSNVTITASTNSGYTWLGWYDKDGTLVTTDYSYSFKMGFAVTYTAKWSKVTLTRNDTGAGSVTSLTGKYKLGDEVTITASTNSGYTFIGWYNGETLLTNELSYKFTMSAENVTYTAKWCKVTLSVSDTKAGSVSTLSGKYVFGEEVTITATTNDGYTFIGWYNGETLLTDELSYTFTMTSENVTYTAKWSANTDTAFKVEYYLENLQGQYVLDHTENETATTDTTVSVTARFIIGFTYYKNKSTTNGNVHGDGSLTLKLYYTRNSYTVSLSRNNTSAGSVSGGGTYDYQKQVTVKATTNAGYTFIGWYNGETLLTNELSYTFEMPAESITYTAKWEVVAEMQNFGFSSTATTCSITGIIDNAVTEIIVPDYVTSISKGAFSGCSNLESMTIPFVGASKSATSASSSTLFGYIFGTSSYTGGSSTKQYYSSSDYATYYIPMSLKKVTITGGNILYGAFNNCSNLTEIVIPDSVTSIGSYAFCGCCSLTEIVIPDSVTSIGSYAFGGCSSLTEIVIPDNVTSIGWYAFTGCSSLTEIVIPDSVTSIGNYAFWCCYSLTIYCEAESQPSGYSDWNPSNCPVVWNCNEKEVADDGYIYAVIDGVRYGLYSDGTAKVVRQPRNIVTANIAESVEYKGITYSVTSIGYGAFYNCSSLTNIIVSENNKVCKSIDGNLYTKDGTTLIQYAIGKTATTFTIPDSVTSIGESAFSNCSNLTEIVIPDSVTSIGGSAFYDCDSLTEIVIPDSVTSIGSYAFASCGSLMSVVIGDSVTSIGEYAFRYCSSLTIYCEAKSEPSGWNDYWNSSNRPVVWGYTGEE